MTKKHCYRTLILLIFIILSANVYAATTFSDVKESDWHYEYITKLAEMGLTKGNDDGTYAPDKQLSIDEFLTFTLRTLGHDVANGDGYWAQPYIDLAMQVGLVYPGQYTRYDVPITREQMSDIIVRAAIDEQFKDYMQYDSVFSDIGRAKDKVSILKAVEMGVLAGYEDGTFRPDSNATRAEAATIVLRMVNESYRVKINNYNGVTYNPATDTKTDGEVTRKKAEDFVMVAVKSIHIGINEKGKAVISGRMPDMPQGQFYVCNINLLGFQGENLSFYSTLSGRDNSSIPWYGNFSVETQVNKEDIGQIMVLMGVAKTDTEMTFLEPKDQFMVSKYYYENEIFGWGNFVMVPGDEAITIKYDYELTKGMWGW